MTCHFTNGRSLKINVFFNSRMSSSEGEERKDGAQVQDNRPFTLVHKTIKKTVNVSYPKLNCKKLILINYQKMSSLFFLAIISTDISFTKFRASF